ncbi:MAG: FAD:protein FMN transferase [Methylotenera sp.]|uniref:FAD:protein FMN transferase n=1 Tax=Methylotenera sp. TaxID=2051956 RepID=UPI0024898211|nr:FAD:protein FMN transferase [Methylotenera sp.]MDI1308760.1 FAD:protein FMN transferase [Methylotenera sp.]
MRFFLILLCVFLTSCAKEPLYQSRGYIFGTLVDIKIYGETDSRANILSDKIMQDFQSLHNRLHAWKPISANKLSEIGELNAAFARGNKPISISPDLAYMLADITKLSVKSNGLFDPAISQLIGVWGFQRDDFSPVNIDAEKIKSLVKANPRMTDIVLKGNTAYSNNPSVKIDLGGYAKGYALDIAAAYLREQHVKGALINVGGNIIAIGNHGDKPWRVGIQNPRDPTAIATLDLPDGWAIGTSGDYQRYFMLEGKRYSHIIDPRSGYPTQHTQAVTVLVPPQATGQIQAGVLSDVVSKPIFIESPERKSQAAQAFNIENYMVIDDKSNIFVSKNMGTKLNWLSPNVKFSTMQ